MSEKSILERVVKDCDPAFDAALLAGGLCAWLAGAGIGVVLAAAWAVVKAADVRRDLREMR